MRAIVLDNVQKYCIAVFYGVNVWTPLDKSWYWRIYAALSIIAIDKPWISHARETKFCWGVKKVHLGKKDKDRGRERTRQIVQILCRPVTLLMST
jgi:hypothetical protein